MKKKKTLVIICGGPSQERGISLNSARSVYDNLDHDRYEISLVYFNPRLEAFSISPKQIYSNTPLDFDYLLKHSRQKFNKSQLEKKLRAADIVFPAIHGTFGEDGQLQKMLENLRVKFIASGSRACELTNDKHACSGFLKKHGYFQLPQISVKKNQRVPKIFGVQKKSRAQKRFVVKPQNGGSSIGVYIVQSQKELEEKIQKVFEIDDSAVIEPYCEGREFTIIVLQNAAREPVSLIPTEIEFCGDRFFDYRKKYLATGETRYHCPPRFRKDEVIKIRRQAEEIFQLLGMRDMARLDGWLMPSGEIWFSDINAISGMEQNSFLFLQPALLGLSHQQVLQYLIEKKITKSVTARREDIPVLFGGTSAERYVSVMSGTNVWVKLKSSKKYRPLPYFFSEDGFFYHVPHFICLHHETEQMEALIRSFQKKLPQVSQEIFSRLGIEKKDLDEPLFVPRRETLSQMAKQYSFFFLGLHGGAGEDGTLQKKLDDLGVRYNGPGAACSRLCMDKFETGRVIDAAKISGVRTARKVLVRFNENPRAVWKRLQGSGFPEIVILKPRDDGCSAGVLKISSAEQLERYFRFVNDDFSVIPEHAIHHSHGAITLPKQRMRDILIEEFIETDKVVLHHLDLEWQERTDWIEVTCGVIGNRNNLHVFNPSQTVADLDVLSLEEKFMGGTGVNFTPPPAKYVSPKIVKIARERIAQIADALGVENYSRLDLFLHRKTGEIIVIEANTLPALTPSTVLFHEALSEKKPLYPRELIEKIIELARTTAR